jgi:hypothetical protein
MLVVHKSGAFVRLAWQQDDCLLGKHGVIFAVGGKN